MPNRILYDLDDLAEITAIFSAKQSRLRGWNIWMQVRTNGGTADIETAHRNKDRAIDQAVRLALDIRQAYDD